MDRTIFAHAYMRRKYNNNNPPKTLADALEMALYDFSLAEADPKVEIWMASWYDKSNDGTCNVCFAGAVMWNRGIKLSFSEQLTQWDRIFYALNELRCGRLQKAIEFFGQTYLPNRKIESWVNSPTKFRSDMQKLLADLRKEEDRCPELKCA